MGIIQGNSYIGGFESFDEQIVGGFYDSDSPPIDFNGIDIEPPQPNHTFGKVCVSSCGSRIVAEVHSDPSNLYERYLAFYDSATLQPVGLGTTCPGVGQYIDWEKPRYLYPNVFIDETIDVSDEYEYHAKHRESQRDINYSRQTVGTFDDGYINWNPTGVDRYSFPTAYESVVHSPVPCGDKILALVEIKYPWTGAHGYGRYHDTPSGHMGVVHLGVFDLDGNVINVFFLNNCTTSKMDRANPYFKHQWYIDYYDSYYTCHFSMGEYGAFKLAASDGYVSIGCTFNQAHHYDTGTFDIYGPGDGIFIYRMGDPRKRGPRYFASIPIPSKTHMDFFPEHLEMGSGFIAATAKPRGNGSVSPYFTYSSSTLSRTYTRNFIARALDYGVNIPALETYSGTEYVAANAPYQSIELHDYTQSPLVTPPSSTSSGNGVTGFDGTNVSPYGSEPYIRIYDYYGLLQAQIGKSTSDTDGLDPFPLNGVWYGGKDLLRTYKTSFKAYNGASTTNIAVNYSGLESISIASGKLVVGITNFNSNRGIIDVYHLRSPSGTDVSELARTDRTKLFRRANDSTTDRFDAFMGKNVGIAGNRIVIASPDADIVGSTGALLYENSGKVDIINTSLNPYEEPAYPGSSLYASVSPDEPSLSERIFETGGILAGYAVTNSGITFKTMRAGVIVLGTEPNNTNSKLKILRTPLQVSPLDILEQK